MHAGNDSNGRLMRMRLSPNVFVSEGIYRLGLVYQVPDALLVLFYSLQTCVC